MPIAQNWHPLCLCDLQEKAMQGVLCHLRGASVTSTAGHVERDLLCSLAFIVLGLARWRYQSICYLQLQTLSWNEMPEQGPLFQRGHLTDLEEWFECGGSPGWQKLLDWASSVESSGQNMDGITTWAQAFNWGSESQVLGCGWDRPRGGFIPELFLCWCLYGTKRFLVQLVYSQTPYFIVGIKDRSGSCTFLHFSSWGVTGWAGDWLNQYCMSKPPRGSPMLWRLQCWYKYPLSGSCVLGE